jgi:dolichol-phosphate mannosyltransferase
MVRLAVDAVMSFSTAPLRFVFEIGLFVALGSFLAGLSAIVGEASGLFSVPRWAAFTLGVAFIGGVQLTVLGVVGTYTARIYEEVKRRPLYLVREVLGFPELDGSGAGPPTGERVGYGAGPSVSRD